MKPETVQAKLNELLGIKPEVVNAITTKKTGRVVGLTEEEIQEFREVQGILYFLEAPALFTPKVCPHCGEGFLVSRKYVKFCSYTCIKKSFEEIGINWTKGNDLEALANDPDVYGGNEPIWIRTRALEKLQDALLIMKGLTSQSSPLPQSKSEPTLSSKPTTPSEDSGSPLVSSSPPTPITPPSVVMKRSSGKKQKRVLGS